MRKQKFALFDGVNYFILIVFALSCLYPFIYCLSVSISGNRAVITSAVRLFPIGFSLDSYKIIIQSNRLVYGFMNAVYYTAAVMVFQLIGTLSYGYMLSRKTFALHKFFNIYTLIPMLFSGGLIPSYILMSKLGFVDSVWAIVMPATISIWGALMTRTYIHTSIPDSLIESAKIDGYNEIMIFARIIIPLSKTLIAILAVYAAMGQWNAYFNSLIYIRTPSKQPLQLILAQMYQTNSVFNMTSLGISSSVVGSDGLIEMIRMKHALIIVAMLPVFAIFPILQKYFRKGVMLGSIKG